MLKYTFVIELVDVSFQVELPPVSEERLRATAEWIQHNVHPVANLVEQPESGEPPQPFEVRSHQVEALAREWQAREEGQNRALGHLATGGGKTTIAVIDAMKYREECAQMDVPVIPRYLYVSHKHEINEQAAKRFRRFMPDAGIEFFDTRQAARRPDADFTFATIQSLCTQLHTFDPQAFENIFWDEAHHLEAVTFKRVLEYFRPLFESAATATVERMDRKDIRDYWGEAVFSKGLPDGIAEGWLADVEYHIVFDKALKEEIAKGFIPKTLKEIEELFEKKVSTEALANSIKEEVGKLGLKDPKMLVFCESIEEADEMAQLLNGVPYHSYTEDRPKILQGLRSGVIKVVTAKDMFNEGVDIPDVEAVVFLRATKSGSLFEQQLGRGLRKIPGKDKVYVLDFVANIERIAKVRELSDAVQKAVGDKGSDLDVADSTGCGGGITVHTKHSEFDFDTVAVDLLEKWGALNSALKAPDNHMSVNGFAQAFGTTHYIIYKLLGDKRRGLPLYMFGNNRAPSLSPELQKFLLSHDEIRVQEAPEGWLSTTAFADKIGVSPSTVRKAIDTETMDSTPRYKFKGVISAAISPERQEELRTLPALQATSPPEGWLSITGFAQKTGTATDTMYKLVREWVSDRGEVLPTHKYQGKIAPSLSPEIQAELMRHPLLQALPLPEGYMSIKDFYKQHETNRATVLKALEDLGIQTQNYRIRGRGKGTDIGLSPEAQQRLKEHPEVLAQPAPEGWKSVSAFSRELKTAPRTLLARLEEMGIETQSYRFKTIVSLGISPENQQYLKEIYQADK